MAATLQSPAMPNKLNRDKMTELRGGRTFREMAKRAGFKVPSQWSDIEYGIKKNISLDTLYKLAGALTVDPCELLIKPKRKAPR
jgi:transcriptional regulator with XRE-family HTH domain